MRILNSSVFGIETKTKRYLFVDTRGHRISDFVSLTFNSIKN